MPNNSFRALGRFSTPRERLQLEDEIKQEMREILKNSNLSKVLEKYGISEKKVLEIQCSIDLTKNQVDQTNSLLAISVPRKFRFNCWCEDEGHCDCR